MTDDLEALAAKGRGADAEREREAASHAQAKADHRQRLHSETLDRTFRETHHSPTPLIIAALGVGGGMIVAMFVALDAAPWILGVGGGLLVALWLAHRAMGARAVEAGLRWVEELPFDFDKDGYLAILAGTRNGTELELSITFREEPTEAERALYADACAGATEVASREWRGQKLLLRSGRLHSFWSATDERASYFSNAVPHDWVRALVDKVVRALHDRGAIATVRVRLQN